MNDINRQNYETFFLLYTDNELSVSEREVVEEFVEANPDLQEELVMLQQSVLKPDSIPFEDIDSLLKPEYLPTELQERLLLYMDDELAPFEKAETDGLISSNDNIKKEWELLQQARFSPDETEIFRDKQILYRKEESARIIAFPWKRIAAAAILLGFGIWGGLAYLNSDKVSTGTADLTKKAEAGSSKKAETIAGTPQAPVAPTVVKITPDTPQEDIATQQEIRKQQQIATQKELATQVKNKKAPVENIVHPVKKQASNTEPAEEDQAAIVKVPKSNNLPEPLFDNINRAERNKSNPGNVIKTQSPPGNEVVKNADKKDAPNEFATTIAYTDKTENNDRVLFMDEEKIKKTKLGGIFRKVKRVLERNTNIKSGDNNIKVANLEFAIQ